MTKARIASVKEMAFGLTKILGFMYTSTGEIGVKIDIGNNNKKFVRFNDEENMYLPNVGKKRNVVPKSFKFEDFFATPKKVADLTRGNLIETSTGIGIFLNYDPETKLIRTLNTNNEILEGTPVFDDEYGFFYVTSYRPVLSLEGTKLSKYDNWQNGKRGKALRNEIMLEQLGIEKDHLMYDFLHSSLTVEAFICNKAEFDFQNTLAADLERASMKTLVANGKLSDVFAYTMAAKIYGISLDEFDDDRDFFIKNKIDFSASAVNAYITKKIIEDFIGEEILDDTADTVEEDGE